MSHGGLYRLFITVLCSACYKCGDMNKALQTVIITSSAT